MQPTSLTIRCFQLPPANGNVMSNDSDRGQLIKSPKMSNDFNGLHVKHIQLFFQFTLLYFELQAATHITDGWPHVQVHSRSDQNYLTQSPFVIPINGSF